MTTTEPVRSSSPELSAMTLPKLKEVASQLGIDGAAKLKKDDLVVAIADLQAANREAAKAEREARRAAPRRPEAGGRGERGGRAGCVRGSHHPQQDRLGDGRRVGSSGTPGSSYQSGRQAPACRAIQFVGRSGDPPACLRSEPQAHLGW